MKLSQIKKQLLEIENVTFELPNGSFVPPHFHITEVGLITKNYIDCGGTIREEKVISLQLWEANDFDHRLDPSKLLSIINLSESKLNLQDFETEVEYQGETIGKYGLDFKNGHFLLTNKLTDCLAKDKCGIPQEKLKINLKDINTAPAPSCSPGGKCC